MKLIHVLEIKNAISRWLARDGKLKLKQSSIVCSASRFNWEVFYASKVQGDSVKFLAGELCPYLTNDGVTKALMAITGVDGTGIGGSGVMKKW